ncbi:class I SAM-dependent methyltransferase [Mycoplasmatota bacterium]|nr:class I SAM-dependent methyltransferase [Mycoplasmatota bacterium]
MKENKHSMTALVSSFSRAYHTKNNDYRVFSDSLATEFLKAEEYESISENMRKGINFFNPSFNGNDSEALEWIVNNQLSPTPLGRAAFAEEMLENAIRIGASQYVILGAGMDTFAFRQPNYVKHLTIFELDLPNTQNFKMKRITDLNWELPKNLSLISTDLTNESWEKALTNCGNFNGSEITYCTLLGLVYYLTVDNFKKLIKKLYNLFPDGSSIVFDYPDENTFTEKASLRVQKQVAMANFSGEKMLAAYSYNEMENILSDCGFLIYDHLTPEDINKRYFETYNNINKHKQIFAFENVNYCLAVKKSCNCS